MRKRPEERTPMLLKAIPEGLLALSMAIRRREKELEEEQKR